MRRAGSGCIVGTPFFRRNLRPYAELGWQGTVRPTVRGPMSFVSLKCPVVGRWVNTDIECQPATLRYLAGHPNEHHRMGRNHLAHASGDAINAVLAAAGYNFRRLLAWLRLLLLRILIALSLPAQPKFV